MKEMEERSWPTHGPTGDVCVEREREGREECVAVTGVEEARKGRGWRGGDANRVPLLHSSPSSPFLLLLLPIPHSLMTQENKRGREGGREGYTEACMDGMELDMEKDSKKKYA